MSWSGPVDEAFVPARSPAVHTVEIDGEAVLLDQAAERLHHLNATAALVWACLDGRSTLGRSPPISVPNWACRRHGPGRHHGRDATAE